MVRSEESMAKVQRAEKVGAVEVTLVAAEREVGSDGNLESREVEPAGLAPEERVGVREAALPWVGLEETRVVKAVEKLRRVPLHTRRAPGHFLCSTP